MEKNSPECGCGRAARNVDGGTSKGFIRAYYDLDVYQNAYEAMLLVYKEIIPKLPRSEYDLIDQLKHSCKTVPRLIAEGHSKRHQAKGFQKYMMMRWLSPMKQPCLPRE